MRIQTVQETVEEADVSAFLLALRNSPSNVMSLPKALDGRASSLPASGFSLLPCLIKIKSRRQLLKAQNVLSLVLLTNG